MNLASLLTNSADKFPDRTALRLDDATLSYAALDDASARVAGLLAGRGVKVGDRVAVMAPNVPQFAPIYYGILRAGGVVVPMNPLLKGREVDYYLADSGAKLIFAFSTFAEPAKEGATSAGAEAIIIDPAGFGPLLAEHEPLTELVERADDDTAVLLYTSGTTGHPKGAELTHDNLYQNVRVCQQDLLDIGPDDVIFGGLPLFHAFGQTCTLNTAVGAGATLLMLPRFDPAVALGLLAKHKATVFAGVPTMYTALLGVPDVPELPDLRVCVSGGAAMPVEVLNRFEERFGCALLEGYGLSETSPVASFNQPHQVRKAGTIGMPVSGVEMRVVNDDGEPLPTGEAGEIQIRGHNIMKGYWGKPEETAKAITEEGWFCSGDIGKVDEDGYFSIVDRKKDLVIRGGFNIYPREIEEVLYEHPDIAEAAVIGIPHDSLGEEVGAAVVLTAGSTSTAHDIRTYVKERVAAYKYPRQVWVTDELPKGPTGKILKREITPPSNEGDK
jgi:long-chain acyl-CoA synthetase